MDQAEASVFSDAVCQLGEGATYDPADDTVYWFDITGRKLLQKTFARGEERIHELPFMASALAVVDGERQLLWTERGLYLRDKKSGALTLHLPLEAENAVTRCNDARVHQSGAFWVSTMGKKQEHQAGSIYWVRKGEVRRLYTDMTVPNSICFSPDGAIAYFVDTRRNVLMRVGCDPHNGLPVGDTAVFVDQHGQPGGMDGSVVDAEGVLWNARWGAGRVDAYAPDGSHLRSIPLPAQRTSCPAFAGPEAGHMVVTSASPPDDAGRAGDPLGGRLLLVDVPMKGRFEPQVAL